MSDIWWSFRHSPLTVVAAIVTALYFLGAIFAPWVAPFDPFDVKSLNLMDAFTPPGAGHLLGTDNQGRDVLSAILYGSRVSLMIGLAAIVLSVTTGVLLGLLAGFRGGWIGAAALGAAMIGSVGFAGFGPLAATLALAATGGALLSRRRKP
ncbi:MAG TPA: hypothetical protein VEP47_05980 [Reyranella sp.]|nr:hypothetical protein [Reyranella sp.]